jgi:hypothetical protein
MSAKGGFASPMIMKLNLFGRSRVEHASSGPSIQANDRQWPAIVSAVLRAAAGLGQI